MPWPIDKGWMGCNKVAVSQNGEAQSRKGCVLAVSQNGEAQSRKGCGAAAAQLSAARHAGLMLYLGVTGASGGEQMRQVGRAAASARCSNLTVHEYSVQSSSAMRGSRVGRLSFLPLAVPWCATS